VFLTNVAPFSAIMISETRLHEVMRKTIDEVLKIGKQKQ
jgi:hypothetical protein